MSDGIPLQFYVDLPQEDVRAFWEQGVDMDDWDYIILAPVELLERYEQYDPDYDESEYTVKEYQLERLLVGCCYNQWYKATFRGTEYAVGVAYHA